jgi:hypothetical protein
MCDAGLVCINIVRGWPPLVAKGKGSHNQMLRLSDEAGALLEEVVERKKKWASQCSPPCVVK